MSNQIVHGINLTNIYRVLASKYRTPTDDIMSITSISITRALAALDSSRSQGEQLQYIYRSATRAIVHHRKKLLEERQHLIYCEYPAHPMVFDNSLDQQGLLKSCLPLLTKKERQLLKESCKGCPYKKGTRERNIWQTRARLLRLKMEKILSEL